MLIRVCAFTDVGNVLSKKIFENWNEMYPIYRDKGDDLAKWTNEGFSKHLPIVFIGACGIAVRTIAPFIQDKLVDSPVIVIDEAGRYVIPILSGHMGGANELAGLIAKRIGAKAVITTATDVREVFSVDVFARINRLNILNRKGILQVALKLLGGTNVTVAIHPDIIYSKKEVPKELVLVPYGEENADILIKVPEDTGEYSGQFITLVPKTMVLGIGCKKGKSFEEIQRVILNKINEDKILQRSVGKALENVYGMASIDLKKSETGLLELAGYYHLPFITFTGEELQTVEGDFEESDFVKQVTGVSNVCERSAKMYAGEDSEILLHKWTDNGVTLAMAKKKPEIRTWETL